MIVNSFLEKRVLSDYSVLVVDMMMIKHDYFTYVFDDI
jgi:hypothetical protein